MNQSIANSLKSSLEPLKETGVISHLFGLAYTKDISENNSDIVSLPIPYDTQDDCADIYTLVPDETKRCIVYFDSEDESISGLEVFSGQIRLVCWYNSKLYAYPSTVETFLIQSFLSKISTSNSNQELSFRVSDFSITNGEPIFRRYDYDKDYICPPFGRFVITIKLSISLRCVENSPNDSPC